MFHAFQQLEVVPTAPKVDTDKLATRNTWFTWQTSHNKAQRDAAINGSFHGEGLSPHIFGEEAYVAPIYVLLTQPVHSFHPAF